MPGNKVLVLLPTDRNILLMQWKGPHKVGAVVGINDYKVKIKDKLKVFHANLLKIKYIEQEEAATVIAPGLVTNVTGNGEPCKLESNPDIGDDSEFLEIGGYVAKESIADVKTGHGLGDTEHTEFHSCSPKPPEPQTPFSIISTSCLVSPSGLSHTLFRIA